MGSFPVMGLKAKTDFLAWVGSGMFPAPPKRTLYFIAACVWFNSLAEMLSAGNCVVFLGDYKNVQFMNDLFGFTLQTSSVFPPNFHMLSPYVSFLE
jgi:hypothetical protein